jgi:hypothetical protein
MLYKSDIDLKTSVLEIDRMLATIEVKGDSVLSLFAVRKLLKEVFDSVETVEEKEEKVEE